MSKVAPWISLSIDWQDSEMFDDSSHGVRLAWICLLCFAKAQGRAGKVRFRGKKFAEDYHLNPEVVEELLQRASRDGAILVDGDYVIVVNWKSYQDPRARSLDSPKRKPRKHVTSKRAHFSKSTENDATHHPVPSTHHPPPPSAEWREVEEVLFGHGVAKAAEAVAAARDAGCNVVQVRNVIEFWRARQPAWGAGALYERLMRLRPDHGFDQHWPPQSVESCCQDSTERQRKKAQQQLAERRRCEEGRETAKRERDRLERSFGEQLDRASRADVKRLIGELWPDGAQFRLQLLPKRGPPVGSLRFELLQAIEKRQEEAIA